MYRSDMAHAALVVTVFHVCDIHIARGSTARHTSTLPLLYMSAMMRAISMSPSNEPTRGSTSATIRIASAASFVTLMVSRSVVMRSRCQWRCHAITISLSTVAASERRACVDDLHRGLVLRQPGERQCQQYQSRHFLLAAADPCIFHGNNPRALKRRCVTAHHLAQVHIQAAWLRAQSPYENLGSILANDVIRWLEQGVTAPRDTG